ncbi:3-oxoacyl-ACP synthase III family protein [uncultured Selenomonas sp.]|uniref:3-oxoacyl-ACP synthase III family protein n=1 Tax=uncultured Selenomonas sp. TaxID=159275 RepID=UPI0025891569|nr:ketoacyl-ACP synthase III [uncultured Selenomonas sp.]
MSQKAYITHIAYELPEHVVENEKGRLRRKTGIVHRHVCAADETASDLAVRAAEKLFADGVQRDGVDYVIFCTQSPDYPLPPTACILQDRLHLSKHVGATDMDLGCSGYEYALGLAKGLIESEQVKTVLILTGETYSKYIHPEDNTVVPLFGDAATATLVEGLDADVSGIQGMTYGTDGSGFRNLIVPIGGMRHHWQDTPVEETVDKCGNKRTNQNLYMNGAAIMNFALEVVPPCVENILRKTGVAKDEVDYYVFHQANHFMLQYLQQKCDLLDANYWNDVKDYGNTVSNSIPIAIHDMMCANPDKDLHHVMLIGFGVGLSWSGCMVDLTRCHLR